MADHRDHLDRTQEIFDFLQGKVPESVRIPKADRPTLTPEQAWTVIWFLGNAYYEVPDFIERCEICGDLFDSNKGGSCLDFGKPPYHFCGDCDNGQAYADKLKSRGGRKYAKENGLIE